MTFGTLLAELNPVKIGCHGSVLEVDRARLRAVPQARESPTGQRTDLDRQEPWLLALARKPGMRLATDNSTLSCGRGGGEMAVREPAVDGCLILDLT